MVMLSQLRRFKVADDQGRQAKLLDLSVALLDADYPPVTSLFFLNDKNKKHSLPWDQVQTLDLKACRIGVKDLKASQKLVAGSLGKDVLLGGDILDALVLDLQNRRATRANDLWLEEDDGQLDLRAADTSFSGFLRRLTGGRYGGMSKSGLYDWKYVEFLRG